MVSRFFGLFRRKDRIDDSADLNCKDLRELSSDYIDGELDEAAASKITNHIGWCKPCNAFISTLRTTVEFLKASPKRTAPSGFRQRIKESIPKQNG